MGAVLSSDLPNKRRAIVMKRDMLVDFAFELLLVALIGVLCAAAVLVPVVTAGGI